MEVDGFEPPMSMTPVLQTGLVTTLVHFLLFMARVELTLRKELDFKSSVSTNSTT